MDEKDNFVRTYTGRIVCPLALEPGDIDPVDIAHHLSNICRFTGAPETHYSVGEHSCRMSDLASPPNKLWALLHDTPEYLLLDMARPIKRAKGYALGREYRKIESQIMEVVCERFGLPVEEPEEIVLLDRIMLVTEQRDLMGHDPLAGNIIEQELYESTKPLAMTIRPWPLGAAKHEFLDRLEELTGVSVGPRTRDEIRRLARMGG